MNRRIYITAAIILTAAFAISCTDDVEVNNSNGGQEQGRNVILFNVDASQDWTHASYNTTRSASDGYYLHTTEVNGINGHRFETHKTTRGQDKKSLAESFNVLAYVYDANETWGTQSVTYSDVAVYNNNSWTMNGRYWPTNDDVTCFIGYAPTDMPNLTVPSIGDSGEPQMTLTVPTTVSDQKDLMLSFTGPVKYGTEGGSVTMQFKHTLTCVKFAVGEHLSVGDVIKSITIRQVANRGTVTVDGIYPWTVDDTSRSDFFMNNINYTVTSGSGGDIIAPDEENGEQKTTMLMIPQTFNDDNDNQVIEMTIRKISDGQVHNVRASLKNSVWRPGTTVTYFISTEPTSGDYVLTASSAVIGHNGGQATFSITSYEKNGDDVTPIPWEIIGYSTDNGASFSYDKPASLNWLGITTTSGTGGAEAQEGVVNVTASPLTSTPDMTDGIVAVMKKQLEDATKKGTETTYYDLSTHDLAGNETPCNTANCYVVNAPGYYKIPLIYGNAIKNGANNPSAYSGTAINHAGNNITAPEITGTPADGTTGGVLCWQDANELVSNVKVSSDKKYLMFQVNKSTITPGNALIAVRENNEAKDIMWSWHIWVTPLDINKTTRVNNRAGYSYDFMASYVGWCPSNGTIKTYDPRSVIIMVRQSGGRTATFRVLQTGGDLLVNSSLGHAPYYQFGRKDPMCPCAAGNTVAYHTLYPTNTDYPYKWQASAGPVSVAESIKNPNVFYCNSGGNWCSTASDSWWNANGTSGIQNGKVVKTIYDPCPVGFQLPPSDAFSGFTMTGENNSSASVANVTNASTCVSDGYYSYMTFSEDKSILLPRNGLILYTNGLKDNNPNCHFWSAMPISAGDVRCYLFAYVLNSQQLPKHQCQRAYGFCVLPVAE